MTLHFETITDTMHATARSVFENFDADYYLAGGTDLALLYGHRKSVDLDYFIAKPIDTRLLKEKLNEVFITGKVEILFETKNTLWCIINGVKVSFISRFDALLEPVQTVGFFRLAHVKDVTVMKLVAVCGREEYKDYFDLACIAKDTDVRSWASWWQEIYSEQDMLSWVVALSAVDSVQEISLEVADNFKNINVSDVIKTLVLEITKQEKLAGGI